MTLHDQQLVQPRPLSRAEELAGIARANRFQAAIESRARDEWAALAPITLDWLIDRNDPADAWQIVWLLAGDPEQFFSADGRARLWQLEQDYVAYRCAHVSIGEQIEIEREIAEETD